MGVGRDHDRNPAVPGRPGKRVADVESLDLAVDLDGDAGRRRGGQRGVDVELQRLALQQPPAGQVAVETTA